MKPVTTAFTILGILIFVVVGMIWYTNTYDGYCDIYFDVRAEGEISKKLIQEVQEDFQNQKSGVFRIVLSQNDCDVKVIIFALDEAGIYQGDLIASRGYCTLTNRSNKLLGTTGWLLFQHSNPVTKDDHIQNTTWYLKTFSDLCTNLASRMAYK